MGKIINGYEVSSLREYVLARGRDLSGQFTPHNIDPYIGRAAVEWLRRLDDAPNPFLGDMKRLAETPERFTDGQLAGVAKWVYNDIKRAEEATERAAAWQDDIAFSAPQQFEMGEACEAGDVVRLGEDGKLWKVAGAGCPTPPGIEIKVPNGYYTVTLEDGSHVTIRLRDDTFAANGVKPPKGQQVASFLSGPDNTSQYTRFATVRGTRFRLFSPFDTRLAEALKFLLTGDATEAGKMYAQASGNCYVCGRLLTDPESISRGIGPICAAGGGI